MIDHILDFAIDHSAVFAALLVVAAVAAATAAVWAFGRYHERASRRRPGDVIG